MNREKGEAFYERYQGTLKPKENRTPNFVRELIISIINEIR